MRSPSRGILRVGGGNVYVGNPNPQQAVDLAVSLKCHSWGWSEASNIAERNARGYRTFLPEGFADMKDASDCIPMARNWLKMRHHSFTQVSDDANPRKIAHDRTFSMVAYDAPFLSKPGKGWAPTVCHISIHPNWVVGINDPKSAVAREFVKSMEALDAMLTFAEAFGWYIVVTGDWNIKPGQSKPFKTPYDVFDAHRLQYKAEGLDGIAWDRRLKLKRWRRVSSRRTKSDHPFWTFADFRRRW